MSTDHLRPGKDVDITRSMIAGSISGLMARMATTPLDTVKIRLQVTPSAQLVPTIKTMLRREGVASLWKGNVPGAIMYVVYGGVQFGSYSFYNRKLYLLSAYIPSQLYSLTVGMLSGATSSFVSYPFDTLRTRFVANRGIRFSSIIESCHQVWMHEGIRGFFRGYTTSMVSLTLATGIMFSTYEAIKMYTEKQRQPLYDTLNASASTISAITSKILTFPIDTVRRRIQLQDSININEFFPHEPNVQAYKQYLSSSAYGPDIIKIPLLMIRHEGVQALYKGLTIGLCKSIPSTVVSLWVYERVMNSGL